MSPAKSAVIPAEIALFVIFTVSGENVSNKIPNPEFLLNSKFEKLEKPGS